MGASTIAAGTGPSARRYLLIAGLAAAAFVAGVAVGHGLGHRGDGYGHRGYGHGHRGKHDFDCHLEVLCMVPVPPRIDPAQYPEDTCRAALAAYRSARLETAAAWQQAESCPREYACDARLVAFAAARQMQAAEPAVSECLGLHPQLRSLPR